MESPPESGAEAERLRALAERALGRRVEAVEPLAAGLGLRRFYRLRLGAPLPEAAGAERARADAPASAIARVEAPEDPRGRPEGVPPEPALEPVRAFLEAEGLPVPARLGGDPERGIDLLEDLGDRSLEAAAREAGPEERRALYAEAVALVPRLQRAADPSGRVPAFGRALDAALLAYKGRLFAEASLPAALGRAPREAERGAVREGFSRIAALLEDAPRRLAHRDLQSRNLLCRPGAPPGARLAMIDLQGAFLAPPEYDLACLLRDSYVELPDAEVEAHLEAVREALPDRPAREPFRDRFALLTLARKAKDHARFCDVAERRGDASALAHLPATVRALRAAAEHAAAAHPELAPLAELVRALPERAPEGPACGR